MDIQSSMNTGKHLPPLENNIILYMQIQYILYFILLSKDVTLYKIESNADVHTSHCRANLISITGLNSTIRFQQFFHFFIICFFQSSPLFLIFLIRVCSMFQEYLSCLEGNCSVMSTYICFHLKTPLPSTCLQGMNKTHFNYI